MNTNGFEGGLSFTGTGAGRWQGPAESVAFDEAGLRERLLDLGRPCFAVRVGDRIGLSAEGGTGAGAAGGAELLAAAPAAPPESLGDPAFRSFHGVRLAYATGAMANGIASEELVIRLGRAGLLGSFGAAGLVSSRLESAILRVKEEIPRGPACFNLIHSPSEDAMERGAVDLYLKHGVTTVEASAFLDLTPNVVRYRAAGLAPGQDGQVEVRNRILAKVSRPEVAEKFLRPAPAEMLRQLAAGGSITPQQAALAELVPMADDLTVEADSGGHTDNRPLVCLLPSILALRDEVQARHRYRVPVRVGAAGGIGTPASVLAAYMMGASYVVTGSVNQSCVEAGTSRHTKEILAQAGEADVMMAPAADMFEMGVRVQVLKRGSFFPMRAARLFELYRSCDSLEDIPPDEREKLEKQVFRKPISEVWDDTVRFFAERDPDQIRRAEDNPKRKMALVFRWYLGLSSRWSIVGDEGRSLDYQVWCGPAMGAFNRWVKGSYLEAPENRRAVDVAHHLLRGAAFLYRLQSLRLQGLQVPYGLGRYVPEAML